MMIFCDTCSFHAASFLLLKFPKFDIICIMRRSIVKVLCLEVPRFLNSL